MSHLNKPERREPCKLWRVPTNKNKSDHASRITKKLTRKENKSEMQVSTFSSLRPSAFSFTILFAHNTKIHFKCVKLERLNENEEKKSLKV